MARTDRLMRLMDALRRLPKPVTAARLAGETGVSPRQIYRDIATLRAGGALIDGEAGLGYTLTEDSALPPQSFSRLEIEALMLAGFNDIYSNFFMRNLNHMHRGWAMFAIAQGLALSVAASFRFN